MNDLLFTGYFKMKKICADGSKKCMKSAFLSNEKGMGTVEIIIIVAVLVALALLFKTFILDMSQDIFNKIQTKTDAAIDDL